MNAIEALSDGPTHVVGHSRGGLIAARLAQRRPDLVKSLTIVDSNSLAPPDPVTPEDFYANLDAQLPNGYQTMHDVSLEPIAQSYSPHHVTDAFCRRLSALRAPAQDTRGAASHARSQGRALEPDVDRAREEALNEIAERGFAVPVGVIWGFNDPSAPPLLGLKLLERLAQRTPRATLHIMARAGHYSFRSSPASSPRLSGTLPAGRAANSVGGERRLSSGIAAAPHRAPATAQRQAQRQTTRDCPSRPQRQAPPDSACNSQASASRQER